MSLKKIWSLYRRTSLPFNPTSPPHSLGSQGRYLVTAGFGRPYEEAAKRLRAQAERTGWFTDVITIGPSSDQLRAPQILQSIQDLQKEYPSGFGLWAWKPLLMLAACEMLPYGSHIYYVDAGCELSTRGRSRFSQLDRIVADTGSLFFHLPFRNRDWTAPSVLAHFRVASQRLQTQATWFAIKNDAKGTQLMAEWCAEATSDDFALLKGIDQHQRVTSAHHRHDQSVLSSLLEAKHPHITTYPWEDFFAPWLYHRDSEILLAPVHALRSRGPVGRLDRLIDDRGTTSSFPVDSMGCRLRRSALWIRFRLEDELRSAVDQVRTRRRIRALKDYK